jgi:sulfur carrier protein
MKLSINNAVFEVPEHSTLDSISGLLQLTTTAGIAIAVNNSVVPRSQWNSLVLKEADNIILIRATQGG